MGDARKSDLDRRLDAYFATLRSSSLRDILKRGAGNWQIYAAVTGSAMAMVTGASAALIGNDAGDALGEPFQSARSVRPFAGSQNPPLVKAFLMAANANANAVQTVAHQGPPTISKGGVVPLFGTTGVIQPGEWISIYGTNLASGTASWNGDFPTTLGGTSVQIDGKAAYIEYVSSTLVNVQAPDDTATGMVSVVVTTAAGTATSTVTLSAYSPTFSLLDKVHVSAIILRSNGSGAYGGGTYDILGPTGTCLGYKTVGAMAGDSVVLFGNGFGPTNPTVPAGAPFVGAAPTTLPFSLVINGVVILPSFVGLASAGLYQINMTVPDGLGQGEVPILASVGGTRTQPGVLFSLASTVPATCTGGGTGGTGVGGGTGGGTGFGGTGFGGTGFGGTGGGTGGGGGGGTGGGSGSNNAPVKPYHPKLRFAEKSGS
jgi:uncharacterized protein (TIGR03437 family)